MKLLSTGLLVLMLASCATQDQHAAGGEPVWVTGQSEEYPASRYLTGRGEAGQLDVAADRARADLAKVFAVNIAERTSDTQTAERVTEQGNTQESDTQRASRQVETFTDQVVRGIEIADVWENPVTKNFHALAVLETRKAANTLRDDIRRLDDATRVNVDRARSEARGLHKVAAAQQALTAQRQRAQANALLQAIDHGNGVAETWSIAQLRNDLQEVLNRIRIQPAVLNDGELQKVLAGNLAVAGFLVQDGERADLVLSAALELTPIEWREGWFWQRATLVLVLRDAAGPELGSTRLPFKASATEREAVLGRLYNDIDAKLKQDLRATLLGFVATP